MRRKSNKRENNKNIQLRTSRAKPSQTTRTRKVMHRRKIANERLTARLQLTYARCIIR
ncbi:hypothetical protein Hanom_Chr11g01057681 [Helianthus anomalus]